MRTKLSDLSRILSTIAIFSNVVFTLILVRNTSLPQIWQLKSILIISQFCSLEVQHTMTDYLFRGLTRPKWKCRWPGLYLEALRDYPLPRLGKLLAGIQFNTVVGLVMSLLSTRGCSWLLKAAHSLAHDALTFKPAATDHVLFIRSSFWHPSPATSLAFTLDQDKALFKSLWLHLAVDNLG